MRKRLGLALALAVWPHLGLAEGESVFEWTMDRDDFGGLSGVDLFADGERFVVTSDRGKFFTGRIVRTDGRISGVADVAVFPVRDTDGKVTRDLHRDAEGVAIRDDGRLYVSFEQFHRVWTYRDPMTEAAWLPRHPDFATLPNNGSLEALAIAPDSAIWTFPENSAGDAYPAYRYEGGLWSTPVWLKRDRKMAPVGADFGPDGRLYILERGFHGLFGFSSRVRRIGPDDVVVWQSAVGEFDNLEGLAVSRAENGKIRLTMISDDNFNPFQSTLIVEVLVQE